MRPSDTKPKPPVADEEVEEEFPEAEQATMIGLDAAELAARLGGGAPPEDQEDDSGEERATIIGVDAASLLAPPAAEPEPPADEPARPAPKKRPSLKMRTIPPPVADDEEEDPHARTAPAQPAFPWDEPQAQAEPEPSPEEGATSYGIDAGSLAARLAESARQQREEEPDEADEPDGGATTFGIDADSLAARLAEEARQRREAEQAQAAPKKRPSLPKMRAVSPEPQATAPSAPPVADEDGDEEIQDPNATMMLGAQSLEPVKPTRQSRSSKPARQSKPSRPSQPGAYSRQLAKSDETPDQTAVKQVPEPPAAGTAKGRLLIPAAALAAIAVLVLGIGFFTRERVSLDQLRLMYPYGFDGMRGPHGEQAPGAMDMKFSYVESVDCTSHTECLRYKYERGSFSGTMVVGKGPDGEWSRVGDEGLPFPVIDREK